MIYFESMIFCIKYFWINDFISTNLDNYLHKHPETADAWLKKIQQSERERKEIAGIKKLANERAKKANLHNNKSRCPICTIASPILTSPCG